jgi:Peptidase family M28
VGAQPRRPRPGSVDRPVNGRLYRMTALAVPIAVIIAAFAVSEASVLPPPALPPVYDGASAFRLADELSRRIPDRSPGSSGAASAAAWVRSHFTELGLEVESAPFEAVVPGRGEVRLENIAAIVRGRSGQAIVVVAHRDNAGEGPGADDNASGTAALIELARAYSAPQIAGVAGRVLPPLNTIVFLSTDGGAAGALGAARFADHSRFADRILAVINLDSLAGPGTPQLHTAGDTARSPSPTLVRSAAVRVQEHTGAAPVRPNALEQLLDLAFPFSLYEQAPFVGRGTSAVTLSTAGERPPTPFDDVPERLDAGSLDRLGRSTQALIGSLDQGFELAGASSARIQLGSRVVPGWAIALVAAAALAPFLLAVVDLIARSRRRRVALLPAVRCFARRLGFWLAAAILFVLLGAVGLWEDGEPRPLSPETTAASDWPTLALLLYASLAAAVWLVVRRRLARRAPVTPEEELGGYTVALAVLAVLGVVVFAWNPFALLLVLPSFHAWLWLPQLRRRPALRAVALAAGFTGPLLLLGSFALRFDLGLDAPWYLVQLAGVGYVPAAAVGLALVWAAAAAQLAAVAAGRYAPYSPRSKRSAAPAGLRRARGTTLGGLAETPVRRRMRVR